MLFAALLLQAAVIYDDPGDAPPVPAPVEHAYNAYVMCLFEPLEPALEGQGPTEPAARRALVQRTLEGCRGQRAATLAEMDAKFPRTGTWRDAGKRRARIAEIVGKAEQRVSFSIVSREEFQAMAADLFKCMNAGGGDSCKPANPIR